MTNTILANEGKTWQRTLDLRVVKSAVGVVIAMEQGWCCRETGEIEFERVPEVQYTNAGEPVMHSFHNTNRNR